MAFVSRIGNVLKQTVSRNANANVELCAPNSMLYQAVRSISSKLFVGDLSYSTDGQSLQEAFAEYGEVIEARIIMDRDNGRSRGFGFVTFVSEEDAQRAMKALDGQELHGRMLRVNFEPCPPRYVGGSYSSSGGYGGGAVGGTNLGVDGPDAVGDFKDDFGPSYSTDEHIIDHDDTSSEESSEDGQLKKLKPSHLYDIVNRSGGRFMALDVDSKKVGVAISGPDNKSSWPMDDEWYLPDIVLKLPKVPHREDKLSKDKFSEQQEDMKELLHNMIVDSAIEGIVIGVPYDEFGKKDHVFESNIRPFIELLKGDKKFNGLHYCHWRENSTSKVLSVLKVPSKPVDNFVASLILIDFFDENVKKD